MSGAQPSQPPASMPFLLLSVSTPSNASFGQPVLQFYQMALPDDFDGSPRAVRIALNAAMRDSEGLAFSDPNGGCVWLSRRNIEGLSLCIATREPPLASPEPDLPPVAQDGPVAATQAALAGEAPLPAVDSPVIVEPTLDAPAMAAAAAGDAEPLPAGPAVAPAAAGPAPAESTP